MSKKFYVISVTYNIEGLFAIVNSVINHCIYAKKQGYIPVINMKHYKNQYFKDNKAYKDNSWEYFFEQPAGYTLDDIKEEDEVIISPNIFYTDIDFSIINKDIPITEFISKNKTVEEKKKECLSILKFNQETKKFLDEKSKVFDLDNTLGVLCRGTDYLKKKPIGEQIQPTVKEVIKKTKDTLKSFPNIKKIYLATEDSDIYNEFKTEFGDLLIENPQYRYDYNKDNNEFLSDIKVNRKNHAYELAKEYLLSVYILSKCKYFIGGRTTGTKWAWILANNWEYTYIWSLGSYGKSPWEQIFSVSIKDSFNKKYKVYRFLGIKIKLRMK